MPKEPATVRHPVRFDLDDVWRAAGGYLRTRKNDVHTPLSYAFAEELCDAHPEADGLVVRLAILLHDTGWHGIDEERIYKEGFSGENWKQSDVRYLHEERGCAIATDLLPPLGYDEDVVGRVCAIIDGHDTRAEAYSLEDGLVRDADRLWRFTPAGIGIASGWFNKTPSEYVSQLENKTFPELKTETGRQLARRELAASRTALKIGLL
jgi:HD domain